MEYREFLKTKHPQLLCKGLELDDRNFHPKLFDFQRMAVQTALRKGRYALFHECGLGKTFQQLEWAQKIVEGYQRPVLIITPIAVGAQTIRDGAKFGIHAEKYSGSAAAPGIYITNYEQLDNIDCSQFYGVVLDESSILKNYTGKIKNKLIRDFEQTPFKLCCTATPSPNDLNEIGNHSEFLGIMPANEMRMRWFVRDEGMNNYRLKKHAKKDFYDWIGQWSSFIANPNELGFTQTSYDMPKLNIHEIQIETEIRQSEKLFNDITVNATNFNKELRLTLNERMARAAEIANNTPGQILIWCKLNDEADLLKSLIPGAVEVRGNEKIEIKEQKLLGFADGEFRVLITKPKIAQFGLNFQSCATQVFASLDFSFESFYQSVRRSYRFGQKNEVNIYCITTDTMQNVSTAINKKELMFNELRENVKMNDKESINLIPDYEKREFKTEFCHLINGDSCEEMRNIPDNSMDFSIFSPPFSNLFIYSDSSRDLGNSADNEEFFKHNEFILNELYRIIKPGRLVAVHSKDLAVYKNSGGYSGMYNFSGAYHNAMEKAGFKFHCRITIWTDPVLEMQRTKTQRLLYKQLRTDSSYSGVGMAEYLTIFRKWEGDENEWTPVNWINKDNTDLDKWQKWASPVWMDILRTDVLQTVNDSAPADEKHICPLQLSVIERAINLWSNPGETIFTPFLGIGSEVYEAIRLGRKGLGIELKDTYFNKAVENCKFAINEFQAPKLF